MKTLKLLLIAAAALTITACEVDDPYYYYDNIPPAPPSNVYILNGDNRVDIEWIYNGEPDVAGYNVYYSYSYDGKYTLLGSTIDNHFADLGAGNGDKVLLRYCCI